jgi:transcriptional regulator with XRE-family HTH domain
MLEKDQKLLYIRLGERIKSARENKGFNQLAFATLLGLSRSSVVNIEKGRQRPSIHLLYEISEITKVNFDKLIRDLLPPKNSLEDSKLKDTISESISSKKSIDKITGLIDELD